MADTLQLLTFDNLAQRVLYRYAFGFADFSPIASDAVSVDSQKAFYEICKSIVQSLVDNPEILGLSTAHPDQWIAAHETLNMFPEVYKVRNDCQKAFVGLSYFLFCAGQFGICSDTCLTVKKADLPKMTAKQLGIYTQLLGHSGIVMEDGGDTLSFEIPAKPGALAAWKLLAAVYAKKQVDHRAPYFILWIYDNDGTYFLERVRQLLQLENDFFHKVNEAYRAKGYNVAFKVDEYRISVIYSKNVSGLCIEFCTLWPTVRFVNQSSIGIKSILEHAADCEDDFVRQLLRFCHPCTDCMGCTKGGKNQPFTVSIRLNNQDHRVCPGFVQMEWYNQDISMEKTQFLLELNELQEKFGKKKK